MEHLVPSFWAIWVEVCGQISWIW